MFACPQIQRCRINLVDDRRSKTGTSKIDSLDVMLAGVASFASHMIEFGGLKISKLRRSLLAAVGANDASKFP
jgi:hypothetical protein